MKLFIEWNLFDENKNLIDRMDKRLSHSFVKNYYNGILGQLTGLANSTANGNDLYDIGGTLRQHATTVFSVASETSRGITIAAGDATAGIVVGSGDTAENFGMGSPPAAIGRALGTLIAHGAGAGQLNYSATTVPALTVSGSGPFTYSIAHVRYFNNASGNNVTVKEVGIYNYGQVAATTSSFMLARDLLASPIVIAHGGQYQVIYTFEFSSPTAL